MACSGTQRPCETSTRVRRMLIGDHGSISDSGHLARIDSSIVVSHAMRRVAALAGPDAARRSVPLRLTPGRDRRIGATSRDKRSAWPRPVMRAVGGIDAPRADAAPEPTAGPAGRNRPAAPRAPGAGAPQAPARARGQARPRIALDKATRARAVVARGSCVALQSEGTDPTS